MEYSSTACPSYISKQKKEQYEISLGYQEILYSKKMGREFFISGTYGVRVLQNIFCCSMKNSETLRQVFYQSEVPSPPMTP
jgi:hypothetical protein